MVKADVKIGKLYRCKVSGNPFATVRITSEAHGGGWNAVNVATKRRVRIKTARRLRREVLGTGNDGPVW